MPSWSPDGRKIAFVSNTALRRTEFRRRSHARPRGPPFGASAIGGAGRAAARRRGWASLAAAPSRAAAPDLSRQRLPYAPGGAAAAPPAGGAGGGAEAQAAEVRQFWHRVVARCWARTAGSGSADGAGAAWLAARAAASVPRGSRARSSSGRRRATGSPAGPRARPRRSGRTARSKRAERPVVVRTVGDGSARGQERRNRRAGAPATRAGRAGARGRRRWRGQPLQIRNPALVGRWRSTDHGQVRSVATTTKPAARRQSVRGKQAAQTCALHGRHGIRNRAPLGLVAQPRQRTRCRAP